MAKREYDITKVEKLESGHIHVEFRAILPNGKEFSSQMNMGPELEANDKWLDHLNEYMERVFNDAEQPQKDMSKYKGKHELKNKVK